MLFTYESKDDAEVILHTDMMKRAVKETQKASKVGKVSFYRANWTLEASSVIPIVFYWHEIVQATHLHNCITLY